MSDPFLRLWSLQAPGAWSTQADGGVGPVHQSGLFYDGAKIRLKRWVASGSGGSWSEIAAAREGTSPVWSANVCQIIGFRFQPGHGIDVPELSGYALPQRNLPLSPGAPPGPYDADPTAPQPGDKLLAFSRLAQACAMPASFVRLTKLSQNGDEGWIQFRLPFRVPLIEDVDGQLRTRTGAAAPQVVSSLDPQLVKAAALAGTDPPNNIVVAIESTRASIAEQREAGLRRTPFLAGGFVFRGQSGIDNLTFESFAINAGCFSTLDGIGGTGNGASQGLREKWIPQKLKRWGMVSALADGFWWARATPNDPTKSLTLTKAITWLKAFPPEPGAAGSTPILAAISPTSPRQTATEPFAPMLALLDEIGLVAADAAAPQAFAGGTLPYHYLHARVPEQQPYPGFEWRRWLKLENPGGAATPALIRVRQGHWTWNPGTNGWRSEAFDPATGADPLYTIWIEGLTDAHLLALWSDKVAAPLRTVVRTRGGRRSLSLLPDLVGKLGNDDGSKGGKWVLKLDCGEQWRAPVLLSSSQCQPPLPEGFIRRASLFRAALGPAEVPDSPLGSALPVPRALPDPIEARALSFPTLPDHSGRPVAFAAGSISVKVAHLQDGGALEWSLAGGEWSLETRHRLELEIKQPEIAAAAQPVAVGGLDLKIQGLTEQKLVIDVRGTLGPLDYDLGETARPLEFGLAGAAVGGTDEIDSTLGDQPLVFPTALLESGRLRCVDRVGGEGRSRKCTMALAPDGSGSGDEQADVLVVDPSPMSIALVSAPKLAQADDKRDILSTWDVDEGLWRLVWTGEQKRPSATLLLPPQGVAEAWERSDTYLPADQVEPDKRVPARLMPAARFKIESDERARNPVAPWNLRRLMADFEVDLPGARLTAIERFEVLYGLEARDSPVAGIRVAEMSAWRGAARAPVRRAETAPEGPDSLPERFKRWETAASLWRGRLAVYDARAEVDPLARPVITNVNYRLRSKAADGHYVLPTVPPAPSGTNSWWMQSDEGGLLGGALAGFEQPSVISALISDASNGHGEIDGLQLSALGAWTRPRALFDNELTLISADVQMGRTTEARFERKGRIGALHHRAKHVIVYRRSFLPGIQFHAVQQHHLGRPIVRKVEEYIEIEQPLRSYPDRESAAAINSGAILGARFRTVRIPVSGGWATPLPGRPYDGYSIPLWRLAEDEIAYPKPVIEVLTASDPARTEPEPAARRIDNPEMLNFYTITAVVDANGGRTSPSGDVEQWPLLYGLDYIDRPLDDPVSTGAIRRDQFQHPSGPGAMLPPAPAIATGLERFTLKLEPGPPVNVTQGRGAKPIMADLATLTIMRAGAVTPSDGQAAPNPLLAMARAPDEIARLLDLADGPLQDGQELTNQAMIILDRLGAAMPDANELAKPCRFAHAPEERIGELIAWLTGARDRLPSSDQWQKGVSTFVAPINEMIRRVDAVRPIDQAIGALLDPVLGKVEREWAQLRTWLDGQVADASAAVGKAAKLIDDLPSWIAILSSLKQSCTQAGADLRALLPELRAKASAEAARRLAEMRNDVDRYEATAKRIAAIGHERLGTLSKAAPKLIAEVHAVLTALEAKTTAQAAKIRALEPELEALLAAVDANVARIESAAADELGGLQREIVAAFDRATGKLTVAGATAKAALEGGRGAIAKFQTDLETKVDEIVTQFTTELRPKFAPMSAEVDAVLKAASDALTSLRDLAMREGAYPQATVDAARAAIDNMLVPLETVRSKLKTAAGEVCQATEAAEEWVRALLTDGKKAVVDMIAKLKGLQNDVAEIKKLLTETGQAFAASYQQLKQGIEEIIDGHALKRILTGSPVQPQKLGEAVALNLLRAAGAPPILEQLAFNREQIAYHFEESARRIIVTPVTALVDQADKVLRGVGVALPTLGIDETLLAPAHAAFGDLRKQGEELFKGLAFKAEDVLKDFAGLKDLLPNLKLDEKLAGAIAITHDYDPKRNVAWMQAAIDYGPETQDLFRHNAFALVAEQMRLNALSRYERGLAGGETRRVKANLISNWVLIVGGINVVRIRKAGIHYDGGSGLRFDIRPENIEFPGSMQLLTQLLAQFGGKDNPLTIELATDASGRPIGLRSRYDLPPTVLGSSPTVALNVCMGVHLDLVQRDEFEIRTFAYFGRKAAPFVLIISWLGGGGYLEAEATHRPRSKRTDLAVAVSIGACAGGGFSLGPLQGQVSVYFGFEASYYSGSGGARLNISALIVISGSVTAWGFVTVTLGIRLAITYDGSKVRGNGHVSVEVRISQFYKKSFSRAFVYKLT